MFCKKCGHQNGSDALRCAHCHAILPEALAQGTQKNQEDAILVPSKIDKIMQWVFLALIPLVAANLMYCMRDSFSFLLFFLIYTVLLWLASFTAGKPSAAWDWEAYFLSLSTQGNLYPTAFWGWKRKISYWLALFFVIGGNLFLLFNR